MNSFNLNPKNIEHWVSRLTISFVYGFYGIYNDTLVPLTSVFFLVKETEN